MAEAKQHWAAEITAYHPDRSYKERIALVYDPTPGGIENEKGGRSYSMRVPALLVTDWIADRNKVADGIALQLNNFAAVLETLKALRNECSGSPRSTNLIGLLAQADAVIAQAEGRT